MKTTSWFLTIFLLVSFNLSAIKNCECGSHSSGIVGYSVSGGGCCTGNTIGMGSIHYYEFDEGGTWVLVRSELVAGPVAQGMCCEHG